MSEREVVAWPLEIATALLAQQQGDMDGLMVLVSREACDEGAVWLKRLHRENEVLHHERQQLGARLDNAARLITRIHALLYPPRTTDKDGRTWEFRSPLVHEQMQELSDRIRALPDELERSGQAASGSQENARSDVQNGVGQPEAPTAAPLEPFRAALAELVELENLRIRAGTISPAEPGCEKEVLMDEWRRRIRPAWSNARAVLADHPPARSGAGSEEGQG